MHLVNDVDLVFSLGRTIRDFLPDLTDIVNTIIGRRINLYHVHGSSCRDRPAGRTLATGASVYRMFTVDRFRKYFRDSRLTGSSGSAKQIGMSDPVVLDLIF